jgi:fructokinase
MHEADDPIVVGLGELLWDVFPSGERPGGAPANFAAMAAQLGARGVVVSAVGDDDPGGALLQWLADATLLAEHVQTNRHPTGMVTVDVAADGKPRYRIHEGVAWDHVEWTPALAELAARADCVCFGSLAQRAPTSRATIRRFLESTPTRCLRIFDVNLRQHYCDREVIERSMTAASVLKLNEEEWPVVSELLGVPRDEARGLAELRRRWDLRLVALTRGAGGSVVFDNNGQVHRSQGHRVRVVDTVGAGDAFTGALAVGILRGRPLDQLHEHATAVAAYVCTRPGGNPRLPEQLTGVRG